MFGSNFVVDNVVVRSVSRLVEGFCRGSVQNGDVVVLLDADWLVHDGLQEAEMGLNWCLFFAQCYSWRHER